MKKLTFVSLMTIISFLALIKLGTAASIPNRFVSTDGNSNAVQFKFFNPLNSGWYFGVYDDVINNGLLLLEGGGDSEAKFEVYTTNNNEWELKVTQGVDVGKTISLGNSEKFSFFFKDDNNYYNPDRIEEDGGIYYFYGPTGSAPLNKQAVIEGVDLKAVPLPSSAWLLISSIIALFMMSRTRRIEN